MIMQLNKTYTLKNGSKSRWTPLKFSSCNRYVWTYCYRGISLNHALKWMTLAEIQDNPPEQQLKIF
jgi:hypothetical protein